MRWIEKGVNARPKTIHPRKPQNLGSFKHREIHQRTRVAIQLGEPLFSQIQQQAPAHPGGERSCAPADPALRKVFERQQAADLTSDGDRDE